MLKITIYNETAITRFVVEGKLAGPWVEELAICWQRILSTDPERAIEVRLVNLTIMDEPGRKLLSKMHKHGARLSANGLLTEAIVEAIVNNEE